MTQTAQASFDTKMADAPAGVGLLGGYVVSLLLAGALVGAAITVLDNSSPIAFDIVPGTGYTVQVQRVTRDGAAVLDAVSSAPFDVPAPPPDQIDVPLSVTVFLTPPAAA